MGLLFDELKKKDRKGSLSKPVSNIGYPTKLLPLDFRNGYVVDVFNKEERVSSWANIGIFGGTFNTICGKTGTSKTAFCVQTCAEICRKFEKSEIYHIDLEGSSNLSRIQLLTKYSNQEMEDKYHYIDDYNAIEDIFEMINLIADVKLSHKEEFIVPTNRKNEYGAVMEQLAPTCIIIDSIPMLMTRELDGEPGMASQTYSNRLAKVLGQFYKRLRPVIKRANIIVMAINHLNAKIDINPMAKSQAQMMYLKADESMPGGNAPLYLAQTLIKFVQCGKFSEEKDGFNGFMIRAEILKSKTNRSGSAANIVYDMKTGFDPYKTIIEYAKECAVIEGRNPYSYFKTRPDRKFDSRKFTDLCQQDPSYFKDAVDACTMYLYAMLSTSAEYKEISNQEKEIRERLGFTDEDD